MAERIEEAPQANGEPQWIYFTVASANASGETAAIAVDRSALDQVMQDDPRPPEILLRVIGERATRRMPVANGSDGTRLITPYNLSLVWPT